MLMRTSFFVILMAAVTASAKADFILSYSGTTVDPEGFRFRYQATLPSESRLEPAGPGQGLVTLYDFVGYVPGTASAPANWTFSTQNVGTTPDETSPNDDLGTTNLTWTYNGPILGAGSGSGVVNLGEFSAVSIFSNLRLDNFVSQAIYDTNGQPARLVSQTVVPAAVPEPSVFLLTAIAGIAGLGLSRRKRSESSPVACKPSPSPTEL